MMQKVYVAGAGGFIGGHLTKNLLEQGIEVIAADIKPLEEWFQNFPYSFPNPVGTQTTILRHNLTRETIDIIVQKVLFKYTIVPIQTK